MHQYFAYFVTKENGFQRKPAPEAIEYLLKLHHIPKEEAIMIGDREIDILSGENAGIASCYFYDGFSKEIGCGKYQITSFDELNTILEIK